MNRTLRTLRTAALLAALTAAPVVAPAAPANPLPRFLEGLQVGPAAEFRLAVVHPVYALPPAEPSPVPALAATVPADALGVAPNPKDTRTAARVDDLSKDAVWLLPGDVLRLADADYAVRTDTVVPGGGGAEADVVRVSAQPADEKPREEPRLRGRLPGPGFLWILLDGAREKEMVATASDLAKETGLKTPRRSPVELAAAETITKRVAEYVKALTRLPRSPAAGRREPAGYAVVLDGAFAGFEVFADPARFQSVWASRLEGIAVEAAVLEAENGVLDGEMAAPTDPDRFTADVKDAILAVYGLDPRPAKVPGLGVVLALRKDRDAGRAVIDVTGAPQHILWLRDPAHRRTAETGEEPEFDPGVIQRKARPTEAEKRWLERRKGREPAPPSSGG